MRARRSRHEWSRIIGEFERSGGTEQAFCRRRGLKVATFRWWRSRLRHESTRGASGVVNLLPVELAAPSPAAVASEGALSDGVVIEVAGVALVRVPLGVDVRYVGALVAELRRC